MISVSVVVPVYSGELYLERLIADLQKLKLQWEESKAPIKLSEVIFIDDSAIDRSPTLINEFARNMVWIRSIHLSRNFGQHAATIAGIIHTTGDWVVTMDEDLQHPPSKIEEMLRLAVNVGNDVIYANANDTVHENWARDLTSRIYKRMIRLLSGNPNVHLFNSFRLIRGPIARAASGICGHSTYFDMALSWFTQRVDVARMTLKDERYIQTGKSGYRFSSLLSHARRMLISSQIKALRLGSLLGVVVLLLSIMGGIFILLQKLFSPQSITLDGWASLMLTILFFSSAMIFLLGIVIEYLSVLILDAHGKPLFFVVDRQSDTELKSYFEMLQPR